MESAAEGDGLPPQPRDGVRAIIATGSNPRSFIDESGAAKSPVAEAGSVQGFGARPVIVSMAGLESDPALIASHERIAPVSTNRSTGPIDGAVHEDLITGEMDSKATTEAILDVASLIGNSRPLSREGERASARPLVDRTRIHRHRPFADEPYG